MWKLMWQRHTSVNTVAQIWKHSGAHLETQCQEVRGRWWSSTGPASQWAPHSGLPSLKREEDAQGQPLTSTHVHTYMHICCAHTCTYTNKSQTSLAFRIFLTFPSSCEWIGSRKLLSSEERLQAPRSGVSPLSALVIHACVWNSVVLQGKWKDFKEQ